MSREVFIEKMKEIMTPKDYRSWRFGQLHPEDLEKYINKVHKKGDKWFYQKH